MTDYIQKVLDEGRKLRQEVRKHGHYLIVEDSPDTISLFRALFASCRKRLDIVSNVDDALLHIQANPSDIQCVVIDLHIPDSEGVGGYRVVEYLEKMRTGIPYVVHTGDARAAKKISEEFPRASVLIKGSALSDMRSLLGLTNENKNKSKD
jgi:CheY-like chemotaxis protein